MLGLSAIRSREYVVASFRYVRSGHPTLCPIFELSLYRVRDLFSISSYQGKSRLHLLSLLSLLSLLLSVVVLFIQETSPAA